MLAGALQTLQMLLALFLIALAVAAVFGRHFDLLAWAQRGAHILARRLLIVLTLGRVRLKPMTRRLRRAARRRPRGSDSDMGGGWQGGRG